MQRRLSETFDSRNNALNLLRLLLAGLVIFSHSFTIGGYGSETLWGHGTLGDIAVDGFFAISGFLIAMSALRTNVGRYLWQRVLRILPGFWACLLVTALVAGPIGWVAAGHPLSGYWSAPDGPAHYLTANFHLSMKSYGIAGTPSGVPETAWDGSLWTLSWEFYCYLVVAVLAVTSLLRRRIVVLIGWAVLWVGCLGASLVPHLHTYTDTTAHNIMRFLPIFLAGSLLWLYREKIPDSAILALAAAILFIAGTFLRNPYVLSGPPLAYVVVWLGVHAPGKRVGSRFDISYGTYIYAFIVAQLLALAGVYRWGYVPFTLLTVLGTLPVALLSCVVVERPALRLKHWLRREPAPEPVPAAALGG